MESEGEKTEEEIVDYKAECEKKDSIIADLKKKLGEYARKTMLLINEKNELKQLLANNKGQNSNSEDLLASEPSNDIHTAIPSDQLLTVSSGKLLGNSTADSESLMDYKAEVEKRDQIIREMSANFKEYSKKTMEIITERNELKSQLEEMEEKLQEFEKTEDKVEGAWKRKAGEAERKVRAIEKILAQKNKDLSEFQSRYIAELAEKDKKIEELLLKITKLEPDVGKKESSEKKS